RGAVWRGIVHALVSADLVQDGVLATVGEARTDPGEIDGGAVECLAHAGPVGGVVASVALLVSVANGRVSFAAVRTACGKHISGSYAFTIESPFFIDDFERVGLTDIHGEVDVVAENVGQIHCQVVAKASALGREKEAAFYLAVGVGGFDVWLELVFLEAVAAIGFFQLQTFQSVYWAAEACKPALLIQFELQALANAQAAQLLGFLAAGQYFMN